MADITLVIGNKVYSSWSLRPWLLLKHIGARFSEVKIDLYTGNYRDRILRYSPAGRVPVLIDGSTTVWESLAICEYAAEKWPSARAWPADPAARAHARSIAAEMHAGFTALRAELPMNCRGRRSGVTPSAQAQADIDRIIQIWQTCFRSYRAAGRPWLFGEFTIADAMYAPVALRFYTYAITLPDDAAAYVTTIVEHPAIKSWIQDARQETEVIAQAERGTPIS
jgi:glutathione S-transferase